MNPQQQSAMSTDSDHNSTTDDDESLTDDSILPNPTPANLMEIKNFFEALTTADREIQQKLRQYIADEVRSNLPVYINYMLFGLS